MADFDFEREMAEALEHAEEAEVVCVILPLIDQCLVYDSRSAEDDPPRLSVSPPLGSAVRRLRHVNRARPGMPHARELAVLPWTSSVQSLEESGIWEMLARRMRNSGFDDAHDECVRVIEELRQWERRSMMAMIRGQGPYETIWPPSE